MITILCLKRVMEEKVIFGISIHSLNLIIKKMVSHVMTQMILMIMNIFLSKKELLIA